MLTIHDLNAYFNAGNSVYKTIEWAKEQSICPEEPIKPFLSKAHSSKEAFEYATCLERYEEEYNTFIVNYNKYCKQDRQIIDSIAYFIKNKSGLYTIPETSQGKVWDTACQDGEGWAGVYDKLVELVYLF